MSNIRWHRCSVAKTAHHSRAQPINAIQAPHFGKSRANRTQPNAASRTHCDVTVERDEGTNNVMIEKMQQRAPDGKMKMNKEYDRMGEIQDTP